MSRNFLVRKIGMKSDVAHILIPEALDTMTAYHLRERMDILLQDGFLKYIINLEDVKFISSTGIQVLFLLQRDLRKKKGKMVLTNVSEKISGLLDTIGVITMFGITEDVEQALNECEPDEE